MINPYNPPNLSGYATLTNGVLTQSENPQANIEDIRYVAQSSVVTGTRDGTWEYPFASIQDAINYWGAPTNQADYNRQLTIIVLDRAVYTETLTWSTRRYGITFVGGTPTGNWTVNIDGALRFGSSFNPTLDVYSASRNLGTQIIGNMTWTLTGTTVTNIAVRLTNILWTGNVLIADGTNGGASITTGTNSQFSMVGSAVTGTFLARNVGVALLDSSIIGNAELQAFLSSGGNSLLNGTNISLYGTSTTTRLITGLSLLSTGGVTWNNVNVGPRWTVDEYTLTQLTSLATVTGNQFVITKNINAHSSDAGSVGAAFDFYHNSASPAANDEVGLIRFYGRDSAANKTLYGDISGFIVDTTDTSEDGGFIASTIRAGVDTEVFRFGSLGTSFNGLLMGRTTLPSPSGSNPTRAVFWNTALNTNALLVGAGGGSGNAMTICDANTDARQIRFGYISTFAIVDSVNTPASGMLFRTTGDYTLACGNASRSRFATFAGTELATVTYEKRFGVGTGATVEAAMHAINVDVPQMRLGYDFTNYLNVQVDASGNTTFDLVGTSPSFTFSDPINITSSLQCDSIVNDTGLAAGTYTPTLTNVTNITSSTAYQCQYLRVGNTVTVSGKVDIEITAAGIYELGMSLPIASNFGADEDCAGTAIGETHTPAAADACWIKADATNDRASINGDDNDTSPHAHYFTFTYQVI